MKHPAELRFLILDFFRYPDVCQVYRLQYSFR